MRMFLNMKRISLSSLAIVTTIAALGSVGVPGVAAAVELPDSGVEGGVVSTQANPNEYASGFYFHVGAGLRLGSPKVTKNEGTLALKLLLDMDTKGAGYTSRFLGMAKRHHELDVEVSWPILQGVKESNTTYTVTSRMYDSKNANRTYYECAVTDSNGKETGPFHCSMARRGLDLDWDLHLTDDGVDRVAEASGSVTTDDSVSLEGGKFRTESPLRLSGAGEVWANSSTQFDAVLTSKDKTSESDTARAHFEYALLVDGQPLYDKATGQRVFVRGDVSNQQGAIVYTGKSSCAIVTQSGVPAESTGYTCSRKESHAKTGTSRVHFITDFTVKKR